MDWGSSNSARAVRSADDIGRLARFSNSLRTSRFISPSPFSPISTRPEDGLGALHSHLGRDIALEMASKGASRCVRRNFVGLKSLSQRAALRWGHALRHGNGALSPPSDIPRKRRESNCDPQRSNRFEIVVVVYRSLFHSRYLFHQLKCDLLSRVFADVNHWDGA